MEKKLFFKLYEFGQKNKGIYNFFLKVTKASFFFFFSIYFTSLAWVYFNNRKIFSKYFFVPFTLMILCYSIRAIVKKQRPFIKYNLELKNKHKNNYCFPSNHSASSLIISILFLSINMYIGVFLILISVLIGISRIILGYHFPIDILFGFFLSVLSGIVFYML